MIRLVASDMDGTLLNRYGKVSLWNRNAIKALEQKNVGFVVCTGRNYEDAYTPLAEAGIHCDIICMNGAAVFSKKGQKLRNQPLFHSQVARILDICRPYSVLFDFMTEAGSSTITSREELKKSFENRVFLSMVADELSYETIESHFQFITEESLFHTGTEIFKMSVVHENPAVLEQIRHHLKKEEGISIASSASTNLELTHEMAQKGSALMEYAIKLKIHPREILALGDSENDLSMLGLPIGYSIAMENASDAVKRCAKIITRTNDEDGVALAIEALILSKEAAVS